MNKCANCKKNVYSTEALRCFDQIWHKNCFRCNKCNKILAIHSSKGYEGKPYCSVHYPQFNSFTFVKDTPEYQQVAANTKNMSKIAYHKEYMNAKGKKISVTDDSSIKNQNAVSKVSNNENTRTSKLPASVNLLSKNDDKKVSNGSSRLSEMSSTTVQTETIEPESDYPKLVFIGGLRVTGTNQHFQAVFDYDAAEDDEVSFREGDQILHGEPIDEGWMYGTVKRTGQFGMLPSNYVVPI